MGSHRLAEGEDHTHQDVRWEELSVESFSVGHTHIKYLISGIS